MLNAQITELQQIYFAIQRSGRIQRKGGSHDVLLKLTKLELKQYRLISKVFDLTVLEQ